MKLTFSWVQMSGRLRAICGSDTSNADGVSIVASLLSDDGGHRLEFSREEVGDGIELVEAVLRGGLPEANWDRETWGVKLLANQAELYSHHDENYLERMPTEAFRRALIAWRDFINSTPNASSSRDIEI